MLPRPFLFFFLSQIYQRRRTVDRQVSDFHHSNQLILLSDDAFSLASMVQKCGCSTSEDLGVYISTHNWRAWGQEGTHYFHDETRRERQRVLPQDPPPVHRWSLCFYLGGSICYPWDPHTAVEKDVCKRTTAKFSLWCAQHKKPCPKGPREVVRPNIGRIKNPMQSRRGWRKAVTISIKRLVILEQWLSITGVQWRLPREAFTGKSGREGKFHAIDRFNKHEIRELKARIYLSSNPHSDEFSVAMSHSILPVWPQSSHKFDMLRGQRAKITIRL